MTACLPCLKYNHCSDLLAAPTLWESLTVLLPCINHCRFLAFHSNNVCYPHTSTVVSLLLWMLQKEEQLKEHWHIQWWETKHNNLDKKYSTGRCALSKRYCRGLELQASHKTGKNLNSLPSLLSTNSITEGVWLLAFFLTPLFHLFSNLKPFSNSLVKIHNMQLQPGTYRGVHHDVYIFLLVANILNAYASLKDHTLHLVKS